MWLLSIAQLLAVVATGAQPQDVAGQTSANLPDPISTRQTYFAIPFEIDQMDHPVLGAAEIQLYVSRDRGATWQHETSVAPTMKHFLFRAAADGEYWFSVRTRDRAGNFRPPLINSPGLRVVVDTQAPALSIDAQRGQAGQITAKWKIDEANIQPESLKLQYRVGDSQQWEDVALDLSKIQTDAATSTGESTWWAPAGQGRIEIRAEVADMAGNRNVSHAQVMTVTAAMPPTNVMAQAPQGNASAATSQQDWQASSGQDAWSQQNNRPSQPGATQSPSPHNAYGQGYGNDMKKMANEPGSHSDYGSGVNSAYSAGPDPSGYDPARTTSPSHKYGVGPNITAQNPQTSVSAPSQPSQQPQYGQYAQNQLPPSQQQAETYPSGYGVPGGAGTNSAWSENSGYGVRNRPDLGTVAAQPAPAYQNQYNPSEAVSQASDRPTGNLGYGTPTQTSAMTAGVTRTVNSKLVEIDYTNPSQPMAVGRVEAWGTRDGGVTWQSFGFDSDSRSPMVTRVPDEGIYGFHVVFHPLHGPVAQPPRQGQTPDIRIRVDLTRPDARLIGVDQSPTQPNELNIRWQASDAQLADTPISLYYADAATGQWRPIAQNLRNSGDYRWNLPIGLPPQVQIRVDATDAAGNIATAETRSPIRLAARSQPQDAGSSYSVQVQDVRPVGQTSQTGQSSQTAPRRYYIR